MITVSALVGGLFGMVFLGIGLYAVGSLLIFILSALVWFAAMTGLGAIVLVWRRSPSLVLGLFPVSWRAAGFTAFCNEMGGVWASASKVLLYPLGMAVAIGIGVGILVALFFAWKELVFFRYLTGLLLVGACIWLGRRRLGRIVLSILGMGTIVAVVLAIWGIVTEGFEWVFDFLGRFSAGWLVRAVLIAVAVVALVVCGVVLQRLMTHAWREMWYRIRYVRDRRFSPAEFVELLSRSSPAQQAALLNRVTPSMLNMGADRLHEFLIDLRKDVKGDPAISSYFARLAWVQDLRRQERAG